MIRTIRHAAPIRPRPSAARAFAPAAKRQFTAAMISRLTQDWIAGGTSADAELYNNIWLLRNRARDLERNNPYMERHLQQAEVNIVGHAGVRMQGRAKDPDGTPDKLANDRVEEGWTLWSKRANCTVTRDMTRREAENTIVRALRRDGEIFVRLVRNFSNPWRFAIQLLEADFIDHLYNAPAGQFGQIKMGVELDEWGAPVAYWTYERHPGDYYAGAGAYEIGRRQRIPASEMLHVYIRQRAGQTRGYPPASTVMLLLKMLNGYEEAELISARAEACKLPVIETPYRDGLDVPPDDSEDGQLIDEFAPGMQIELPYGKTVKAYDPTHPNGNFADFRKAILRGVAAGLGTGYNTLAQDLEGVNFSSLRSGLLDEREFWKSAQSTLIEQFEEPLFEAWLEMALLTGMVNLPPVKLSKFSAVTFKGRRWDWVDPMKEAQAAREAIALRVKSRTEVIEEKGGDIEDVLQDFANEQALADEIGVELEPAPEAPAGKAPAPAEEEDDTEEADDGAEPQDATD